VPQVQANWHTGDLPVDTSDPFSDDEPAGPLPVEQVGTPIDLSQGTAKLAGDLQALLKRADQLYSDGVTCELMEHDDMTCAVCPLSEAESDSPLSALCRVGRELETTLAQLLVSRNGG
jgi:hypothetical protein